MEHNDAMYKEYIELLNAAQNYFREKVSSKNPATQESSPHGVVIVETGTSKQKTEKRKRNAFK